MAKGVYRRDSLCHMKRLTFPFFSLSLKFYFIWGRGLQGQRVDTKGGEMNGIEKQDVFFKESS